MNRNNILRIISVIVYIILVVVIVPFPLGDDIDTLGKLLRPYELVFIGSVLIGTIAGISGLKIFLDASNNVHMFIREKKEYTDETVVSRIISAIEAPMRISDQLESERLRTGIKIATLIFVPFVIVYTMYIIVCVAFFVMLMLIIIAFIIGFVSSILGIELPGLPSFGGGGGSSGGGGGGSSSGSGGGRSSSSSSAIFGSSYEETAKEESRPFKVDKETKSSEGALPFGLGGDTIYKTEYEDTSTGETVKGHGWTRSEADFNARKNLKNK